jgi:hypothetical protein
MLTRDRKSEGNLHNVAKKSHSGTSDLTAKKIFKKFTQKTPLHLTLENSRFSSKIQSNL